MPVDHICRAIGPSKNQLVCPDHAVADQSDPIDHTADVPLLHKRVRAGLAYGLNSNPYSVRNLGRRAIALRGTTRRASSGTSIVLQS